jgi:adenine C2-methylase RlmN of 23S rRNA A2503 and tRNA A37
MIITRKEQLQRLFPDLPSFRLQQMDEALFRDTFQCWDDVSNLSLAMRKCLSSEITWLSCKELVTFESKAGDTFKALLEVEGEHRIETVLMKNKREQWSVCVSSQVGCAMRCTFCATGTMGLKRNLTSDEIIDQYRFWKIFLAKRPELFQRISNIVFMGMGEPLANYEHVREALRTILKHTDIGPTRITVSTVGLVPMLEKLLDDHEWPPVRLAVSLHSADNETRKSIMPSSYDGFLEKLAEWSKRYFEKFDTKRRHLTFEYVMLDGVNDTPMHADALVDFARKVGKARINLIPYNFTGSRYAQTTQGRLNTFLTHLKAKNVDVTKRRTMGDDIAAACGQLAGEKR